MREVWKLGLGGGSCVLDALDANGLARALAGARIGLRALSAHGEAAAMTEAAVAGDGLKALEGLLNVAAKVALDQNLLRGDRVDDRVQLLRRKILRAEVGIHVRGFEHFLRIARPDAVDVWERHF